VKHAFTSQSKTRRSSRKKTRKRTPPAASFSTKPEEPPTVKSLSKVKAPLAAFHNTTSDLGKTTGDNSLSDLGKTNANEAKADTSKSKANEDYLPPLSNKRKDPPGLHAKTPRKTQKVGKAVLKKKRF
jgi:hypothetical protein